MKVAIQKQKKLHSGIPWTACEPFVENTMAKLVHRVRYLTTHKIGPSWPAHLAVGFWCGNGSTGTKKLTFLSAPPENGIVCHRCEQVVQKLGLPSSSQLAGRHVHLGKLVAVRLCCTEESKETP